MTTLTVGPGGGSGGFCSLGRLFVMGSWIMRGKGIRKNLWGKGFRSKNRRGGGV